MIEVMVETLAGVANLLVVLVLALVGGAIGGAGVRALWQMLDRWQTPRQ